MTTFQEQLDEAFPAATDAALSRTVAQAVALAADVMDNESFLASLMGGDIRGHVRRAAVLFGVHEACRTGDLPFRSDMLRMPLGGGHWVELRSGVFRAHVCRTDGPGAFPEETPTRQDQRVSNQLELALDPVVVPIRPDVICRDLYAWLTFGASGRDLSHLCWAMPEASRDSWLARTNVLARLGPVERAPEARPAPALRLRFREHIEESLRRGDDADAAT